MLRLRHLVIQRFADPTVDRVHEWIGHLASEDEVADLLYSRFRCFSGVVLVAKQPDAIVGICGWQQDEGFGLLGPILIRKDKRRWGGGTHLVEQAVDEMRTEGIRTIESAYLSEDPCGQRLFTRCRFKTLGNETFPDGSEWTRVERKLKKTG